MTSRPIAHPRRWYPLLLAVVGAGLSLAVYPRLPETMAVHWDMDGTPDGWMPRPFGAFFGPVFLLVLWQVMRLAPRVRSRADADSRFDGAYETVVASTLLIVLASHLIVLAVALGHDVPVNRVVPALVGMLFAAVGSVMPRLRSNGWFGIRTPWTLSSERVWARTHRLAGTSMIGAGAVMILAALVVPASLGLPVVLGAAVAAVIGPAVYSYLTWRREQKR